MMTRTVKKMVKMIGRWKARTSNLYKQMVYKLKYQVWLKTFKWALKSWRNWGQHLQTLNSVAIIVIVMIRMDSPEALDQTRAEAMMMKKALGTKGKETWTKKTFLSSLHKNHPTTRTKRISPIQRWTTDLKTRCRIHTTTSKVWWTKSTIPNKMDNSSRLKE